MSLNAYNYALWRLKGINFQQKTRFMHYLSKFERVSLISFIYLTCQSLCTISAILMHYLIPVPCDDMTGTWQAHSAGSYPDQRKQTVVPILQTKQKIGNL